jgi:hypothetical protein
MAISYNPTTNFGAKDALPAGDPDKVIKGSEFTTEFQAISNAFQGAVVSASPNFSGTTTVADLTVTGTATFTNPLPDPAGYNSANWDTAFGWGDHSTAGYIAAAGYNNANWDSAFAWGNHASAGYLTASSSVPVTEVVMGLWKIKVSGTNLVFEYNAADVFKLTDAGALSVLADITATAVI